MRPFVFIKYILIMELSKIPTGCSDVKFLPQSVLDNLADYDEAKKALELGCNYGVDYYWFNNKPWSSENPIGCMPKDEAEYRGLDNKYFSISDLDCTVPAYTKEQLKTFNSER